MRSLKRSVITFFRVTGLRWLVMGALNLLAWLVLGLARLVGWLYAKAYPVLGLDSYDQRFHWMLGPRSWRWAERGIVSYQAGIPGGRVLDLACGEGLYPGAPALCPRLDGTASGTDRHCTGRGPSHEAESYAARLDCAGVYARLIRLPEHGASAVLWLELATFLGFALVPGI